MSLKQTLLALSLGGSALTSCSVIQNQPVNDVPPAQPAPITQSVQDQKASTKEQEKLQLPTINLSPNIDAEKFHTNFTSLTDSLERVDFGNNKEQKETTIYALHDLAQYEFGQRIIANAPAGIQFRPDISPDTNRSGTYYDNDNTIELCQNLYEGDYFFVVDVLAHEMTHGIQNAHGRTNDYLCSPVQAVVLNKLCEAEALSIGSIASAVCDWKLNSSENIKGFTEYDLIGWYKKNYKDFNVEDYKKTDPTYLFQQALKTTKDINLAARITTGQIAKNYIQKNPSKTAVSWQTQYDQVALDAVKASEGEIYLSNGNTELFNHNVQYYKEQYGLTNSDIKMGLSQDMEDRFIQTVLKLNQNGDLENASQELDWQKWKADLFVFCLHEAKSVEDIKDSLYYFKYSKPEHSLEAQALLTSENPIAQKALVELTNEGFLKYDVHALRPQTPKQVNTLKNIEKKYNLITTRPTRETFLNPSNHSVHQPQLTSMKFSNSSLLNMNDLRPAPAPYIQDNVPNAGPLSRYFKSFGPSNSSR